MKARKHHCYASGELGWPRKHIDEFRASRAKAEDQARIVGDDLAVLYLAFSFCALLAYDLFLLKQYDVAYWNFGFALLNALVITKVIMIGGELSSTTRVTNNHQTQPQRRRL